jgi:hypothetical protein
MGKGSIGSFPDPHSSPLIIPVNEKFTPRYDAGRIRYVSAARTTTRLAWASTTTIEIPRSIGGATASPKSATCRATS